MALKGSAKIELVNADGTKEVVEHGNMITNAVNDLLYSARGEQSNILRICNNGDSFVEQLFGGILLFKHTLTDDPDDYYIPSVNTVGYANLGAYNGLDVERGGYNASESGLQEDGSYKLVWDFTTSQANGTIKSIALCPNLMGKIGLSNSAVSSEKVSATTLRPAIEPFSTSLNLLPRSGDTEGWSNFGYNIFAVDGNTAYAVHTDNLNCENAISFKKNGGILKIFRFDITCGKVSLKSKVGSARYIDCTDVQLPSEFVSKVQTNNSAVCYSYDSDKRKLSMFMGYNNRIEKNGVSYYVDIDIANGMSVSARTFTNNSPGYINISAGITSDNGGIGHLSPLYITGDYIVFSAILDDGANKLYVTRKDDNTDIKEVRWENGNEFRLVNSYYIRPVFSFGNLFVFGESKGYQYSPFIKTYIVDLTTGVLKETNATEMTYCGNTPLGNKVTWCRKGTYLALGISVCPFVLTTKNNLDAPVTKTASQTMKITYTLTETAGV